MCFSGLLRRRLCFVLRIVLAILSTISLGVLAAEPPVDPEQRIRHIQDAILPAVLTKGEPPAATKLADRMAALHVPGVSIAVIHHGAIEWAQGFGVASVGGAAVNAETLFQAASIKPCASGTSTTAPRSPRFPSPFPAFLPKSTPWTTTSTWSPAWTDARYWSASRTTSSSRRA